MRPLAKGHTAYKKLNPGSNLGLSNATAQALSYCTTPALTHLRNSLPSNSQSQLSPCNQFGNFQGQSEEERGGERGWRALIGRDASVASMP